MHKRRLRGAGYGHAWWLWRWAWAWPRQYRQQKTGVWAGFTSCAGPSVRGKEDRLRDLGDSYSKKSSRSLSLSEELQKLQTEFRTQKDLLTEQARAAR